MAVDILSQRYSIKPWEILENMSPGAVDSLAEAASERVRLLEEDGPKKKQKGIEENDFQSDVSPVEVQKGTIERMLKGRKGRPNA